MTHPLATRRFTTLAAATVTATALLLTACGAGEQDSTDTKTSGGTSTAADRAGTAQAKKDVAAWAAAPQWPDVPKLSRKVDLKGKRFTYVALGDQVPVIHGVGVGVQQALSAAGATVDTCDGKFNPTSIASCLKTAGDEKADGVITSFIDYQMAGPAFDQLAHKGVKVVVGGVAPSGGRTNDATLAFYDNTPRVFALHEAMAESAVAQLGDSAKVVWAKLMDSTTTRTASAKGIAKFRELCPGCQIDSVEFTTVNLDKLGLAISAALLKNPDTNAVIVPVDTMVPSVLQGIQSAGKAGRIKVFSSSSDLAGLQRVKDGRQASDLGTPVLYEGWRFAHAMMQLLAGDDVSKGDQLVTRDFTGDNVGSLTLTPQKYLSDDWFGGSGYRARFLTAWGLK
ncbi:substrate-binding domain-containing protein [Streptomyces shenzhenensis]|uniref:sugar ABC transporter substrate-binding protein n=1 Tax=Streptomyces TaxID=1883 RepID=UPI001F262D26|nr:substrate-binding domain-containing protein [Streptomyces shenzhenensis]